MFSRICVKPFLDFRRFRLRRCSEANLRVKTSGVVRQDKIPREVTARFEVYMLNYFAESPKLNDIDVEREC